MSSKDLLFRVECYVGLRHAMGYVVRSEEKLLKDFVRFIGAYVSFGRPQCKTLRKFKKSRQKHCLSHPRLKHVSGRVCE